MKLAVFLAFAAVVCWALWHSSKLRKRIAEDDRNHPWDEHLW